ncbi:MAG: histidine kinase dimerization/phospho-acceptor domain-containing protein [Pseudomonadota bacterium]
MRRAFDAIGASRGCRESASAGSALTLAEALSHELRSPLTVIRCCAEALRDDPDMAPEDRARLTVLVLEAEARLEAAVAQAVAFAEDDLSRSRRLQGDALRPS